MLLERLSAVERTVTRVVVERRGVAGRIPEMLLQRLFAVERTVARRAIEGNGILFDVSRRVNKE